jgi:hypothetical protein
MYTPKLFKTICETFFRSKIKKFVKKVAANKREEDKLKNKFQAEVEEDTKEEKKSTLQEKRKFIILNKETMFINNKTYKTYGNNTAEKQLSSDSSDSNKSDSDQDDIVANAAIELRKKVKLYAEPKFYDKPIVMKEPHVSPFFMNRTKVNTSKLINNTNTKIAKKKASIQSLLPLPLPLPPPQQQQIKTVSSSSPVLLPEHPKNTKEEYFQMYQLSIINNDKIKFNDVLHQVEHYYTLKNNFIYSLHIWEHKATTAATRTTTTTTDTTDCVTGEPTMLPPSIPTSTMVYVIECNAYYILHYLLKKENIDPLILAEEVENHSHRRHDTTPVHLASKYGHSICLQLLINQINERVHSYRLKNIYSKKDNNGNTPMHLAASCNNNNSAECVRILLQSTPSVLTQKNKDGLTPLQLACFTGTLSTVELLWKVNSKTNLNNSTAATTSTTKNGNYNNNGKGVGRGHYHRCLPIEIAAIHGRCIILKYLCEQMNLSIENTNTLNYACMFNHSMNHLHCVRPFF